MQVATRLSTSELRGVTLYEPTELVVSARSGTPLAEIEALLDKNGQELAFEPSIWRRFPRRAARRADDRRHDRGELLRSAPHPARQRARSSDRRARRQRPGEIIKSGGRVMKNVTGYDLARGIAGSWGTLAVLSEVTLKVLPKAEEVAHADLPQSAGRGRGDAMCRAMGSAFEISARCICRRPSSSGCTIPTSPSSAAGDGTAGGEFFRFAGLPRARACMRSCGRSARSTSWTMPARAASGATSRGWYSCPAATGRSGASPPRPIMRAKLVSGVARPARLPGGLEWSGGLIWLEVSPATDAGATVLRRVIAEFQADATLIRAGPPRAPRSTCSSRCRR